jgi:hypothetical protein
MTSNVGMADNTTDAKPPFSEHRAGHWVQIDAPEQVARLMLTDA